MTSSCDGERGGGRFHFDAAHAPMSAAVEAAIHVVAATDGLEDAVTSLDVPVVRYRSGEEFLPTAASAAGCLLCEAELPGLSGLDLQERLRGTGVRLPAVFLSGRGVIADAVQAMRNGAVTFLRLPCPAEEIRSAAAEALALARPAGPRTAARFASLEAEESAVLTMLLDGLPNKAVAMRLGVGLRTVERRRASALRSLGVDSVVAAAVLRSEAGGTGGRVAAGA